MRYVVLVIGALALPAASALAQDVRPWAEKLFDYKTEHSFGNVPHGAQLAHQFAFSNPYQVPLDVSITRISCGCVTASSSVQRVEPRKTGFIDVTMNTRQFTGPRTVRVYVTFSHPQYYSTAELKVAVNSRPDVVFNPGQVNFGVVAQGQPVKQTIEVEYAGALAWRVHEVSANGLPVEVRHEKLAAQRPNEVRYGITVTLKPDAPAGALKGEILLKTNDPASPLVPVLVEANVQPSLTVAPASLRCNLKVSEEATASVVVRGNKEFRILGVEGLGDGISLTTRLPDAAALTHRLSFVLRREAAGEFRRTLQIKTDLQQTPVTVTVEGTASP